MWRGKRCQKKFVLQYLSLVHHFCNYTHGWFLLALKNSFPMTFMSPNWTKCGEKFPAVLIVLGNDVRRTQPYVWIGIIVIPVSPPCISLFRCSFSSNTLLFSMWRVKPDQKKTKRFVRKCVHLLAAHTWPLSPILPARESLMNGHHPITMLINKGLNRVMDCDCMAESKRRQWGWHGPLLCGASQVVQHLSGWHYNHYLDYLKIAEF